MAVRGIESVARFKLLWGESGWEPGRVGVRVRAESVHHVDLRVTNYRKSVSFYNGILRPLGFRTISIRGEVVTYYLKGPTALGIRPVKKRSERNISYSYKRAGIHHVAFSVETKSDVDEFYRLLRQKHVRVLYPPQKYPRYGRGYYSVFFLDPDGIDPEVFHWDIQHPRTKRRYLRSARANCRLLRGSSKSPARRC